MSGKAEDDEAVQWRCIHICDLNKDLWYHHEPLDFYEGEDLEEHLFFRILLWVFQNDDVYTFYYIISHYSRGLDEIRRLGYPNIPRLLLESTLFGRENCFNAILSGAVGPVQILPTESPLFKSITRFAHGRFQLLIHRGAPLDQPCLSVHSPYYGMTPLEALFHAIRSDSSWNPTHNMTEMFAILLQTPEVQLLTLNCLLKALSIKVIERIIHQKAKDGNFFDLALIMYVDLAYNLGIPEEQYLLKSCVTDTAELNLFNKMVERIFKPPVVENAGKNVGFTEFLQRDLQVHQAGRTKPNDIWPHGVVIGGLVQKREISPARMFFSGNGLRNYQRATFFRALQTSETSRIYTSMVTPPPTAMMGAAHQLAKAWSVGSSVICRMGRG